MKDILRYWGKSEINHGDENDVLWHPLLYHSLDCAAVAKMWMSHSPGIRRALSVQNNIDEITPWILFFIYMHDYGKLSAAFQTLNISLWRKLFSDFGADIQQMSMTPYQHGTEGVKKFYKDIGIDPDSFDECEWMKEAGEHHHRYKEGKPRIQVFSKTDSPLWNHESRARNEFINIGKSLFFKGVSVDFLNAPPVPNTFKGFCSVCDWVASNPDFFPFSTKEILPLDYFESRRPLAQRSLKLCGLINTKPKKFGMSGLFPEYEPRGVQGINVPIEEGGLYIIEAPTGSGKTEAALSIASSLIEQGHADSIIFALPTQATANSMFERLEKVASKMYPEGSNIVLAHGKSRFNEGFRTLCQQGSKRESDIGLQQCSEWLATSKKRAFLGQIGICTVDQVLIGALPVRHNFVRAFATGRGVLIVDEVHAYDSYMNGLLDKILKKQRESNGNVILLSATLPSQRKQDLISNWSHGLTDKLSTEYPLITTVSKDNLFKEFIPKEKTEVKPVNIELRFDDNTLPDLELIKELINYAEQGFTVAVICNLVSDAQATWQKIKSITNKVKIDLFHGRYAFSDRSEIENQVIASYGKDRKEGAGSILIATQVIEQSLDLDFDLLVTQLCPVELLFQRLGRLHRHKRTQRPSEVPRCIILSPKGDDFGLHSYIYSNPAYLWRARSLIQSEPLVMFPEAYRRWIELAHSRLKNEPEFITKADEQFAIEELGREYLARNICAMDASEMSDSRAELLTRDGDMGTNLLPVDMNACLLDENKTPLSTLYSDKKNLGASEVVQLQTIPCPSGWHKKLIPSVIIDDYVVINVVQDGDSWFYVSEDKKLQFMYSRQEGLRKE